ncbi:MAG TPA: hypothetical protein VFG59_07785 [Anaeromyxobacter sp.]|nr:hypothetical protein [Anaeromyxobacter sp.]
MNGTPLPPALQIGSGVLILATGAFLVAGHAILNALASRTAPAPRARRAPWLVGGYLSLWLAVALISADAANFPQPRPLVRLLLAAVVGFGPLVLALALLLGSKTLQTLNSSMDPAWLVRLQVYRMGGLVFLFPFLAYGVVPAGFAWPAATGDFLTGFAALFVGWALARRRPGARGWAIAWNVFGILDLIVAPTAAILSSTDVTTQYPLALIPLFVGPPVGILTHVCSLRNLATVAGRQATRHALSPAEALGTT